MKTFYILSKPQINNFDTDIKVVSDEFYVTAGLFNALWAMNNRLWSVAWLWASIMFLLLVCKTNAVVHPHFVTLFYAFFFIYCGYSAPQHLVTRHLINGLTKMDIVMAYNDDEAKLKAIESL